MRNKILISIIVLTVIFSPVVKPIPAAHASFPTIDFANLFQKIWENYIQPALSSALKKQILDKIVDQLIVSIQGGGKPQFVTDWAGFLDEAAQGSAGDFAQVVGAGFLCEPFSLQIQLSLLPVTKFSQQTQCTLKQIVGNIQAFYNDFRTGGWLAYGEAWQPQNNYYGALLMVTFEGENRKAKEMAAKTNEALSGGGFLGTRGPDGSIVTPGSTIGTAIADAIGYDAKFILAAEDVGEYAGAIVNAMINRLFTTGLAAIRPASSQAQLDAANAAYEASVVANAFNGARSAALENIGTTLGPREDAQALIDSTITNLNNFKITLAGISNDLAATGRSTCIGGIVVADVRNQITAEIATADTQVAQLNTLGTENHTTIDPLRTAVNEINQMVPTRASISRLDQLNGETFPLLNETAANAFLTSTQAETNSITTNITQKTATFNQQLQQCRL